MPLSEDEQKILSEIEAKLYETDPSLAKEVGSTTVYSEPLRSLRWATLGFIAGLVMMIFTLATSYWLAFEDTFSECQLLTVGPRGIWMVTHPRR